MEMVIDTLSYCEDLSDPAFSMYEVMSNAVEKKFTIHYMISKQYL